nr:HAMP domain-containing sensor histidine kinase [Deinobacterium chartae]
MAVVMVSVVGILERNLYAAVRNDLQQNLLQITEINNKTYLRLLLNLQGRDIVYPDVFYQLDTVLGIGGTLEQVRQLSGEDIVNALDRVDASATLANQPPIRLAAEDYRALISNPDNYITVRRSIELADGPHTLMLLLSLAEIPLPTASGTLNTLGIIYIGKDLGAIDDAIRRLQVIMWVVSLVAIVGMGAGSYILSGRALKPLRQVRDAAEEISEKTLRRRVPEPNTADEVAALAKTLNRMLGRLEASFEMQRRFTSDASHELRTPVTAIGGHAGYLLRRTQVTEQQAESLNIIKNESERLSQLISSLLELARADSGGSPLQVQPMLAQPFLEDILREMRPLLGDSTLEVQGEEVDFHADPSKLRQVVINLVSNALKAGAKHITMRSSLEEGAVHFRIEDNGPGIPAEHLEKLFDRFYRVEESRSRDVGGSGLGLSIAKSIVDAHGGRIWIESSLGVGTTVHVLLPLEEKPAEKPAGKGRAERRERVEG